MKKIKFTAALLVLCLSLCSCAGMRADIDQYKSKETIADVDNVPDDGENGEPYAKPATFAGLYSTISDLRNDFYDTLSASLSEVRDDTQIFIDIYKAMAGESTFVYISACGTGNDQILKKALSLGDFINTEISETETGWRIDLEAKTDKGYRKGGFDVVFDGESDGFALDFSLEDGTLKKFYAKRAEKGYIAQYLDSDGLYIRYILEDDGTGKMFVCDGALWQSRLPDTEAEFEVDEFTEFYELTEDKFHSLCNGIEDTYPKVKPD